MPIQRIELHIRGGELKDTVADLVDMMQARTIGSFELAKEDATDPLISVFGDRNFRLKISTTTRPLSSDTARDVVTVFKAPSLRSAQVAYISLVEISDIKDILE